MSSHLHMRLLPSLSLFLAFLRCSGYRSECRHSAPPLLPLLPSLPPLLSNGWSFSLSGIIRCLLGSRKELVCAIKVLYCRPIYVLFQLVSNIFVSFHHQEKSRNTIVSAYFPQPGEIMFSLFLLASWGRALTVWFR